MQPRDAAVLAVASTYSEGMPSHVAIGTWSGGRFMRFGEPVPEGRLEALLRPAASIQS